MYVFFSPGFCRSTRFERPTAFSPGCHGPQAPKPAQRSFFVQYFATSSSSFRSQSLWWQYMYIYGVVLIKTLVRRGWSISSRQSPATPPQKDLWKSILNSAGVFPIMAGWECNKDFKNSLKWMLSKSTDTMPLFTIVKNLQFQCLRSAFFRGQIETPAKSLTSLVINQVTVLIIVDQRVKIIIYDQVSGAGQRGADRDQQSGPVRHRPR